MSHQASETEGWEGLEGLTKIRLCQKSGSANAAVGVDSDSEGKGVFAAVAVDDYDSDGSLPSLEAVSDSDSESESGNAPESDWFFEAVNERGSDCGISEGSDWDPDDLFEDSMPTVDAPFSTPHVPKYMTPVVPHIFPHTARISKISSKFPQSLSELPISKIFKLYASRKFFTPPRWDTPSCLLDDSTTLVFQLLLEVASVSFKVLMGRI
ncbi:hypothetical protein K443DRAFT_110507 [Laccaria amethystina LaAM-08-1]|uniref:Uncharacterized protein n=1 Tax=Laccaria amethystina LaAM-08-1 TaxID=1095629 RepID=A0A0C9WJB3_9AGAR|nr:hypothetical protein K443DRAFT_110507 [Laccaria amethystina LaAM-08-1]